MNERAAGFYWVRFDAEWTIAEWNGVYWTAPFFLHAEERSDVAPEIGPRIEPPI